MSQFINDSEYSSDFSSEIDFDAAELLDGGGSTCDIYRTRWQRHTVFVKRLKEKYRAAPIYLDALDKEYEIGVRLKHESLPTYLHFHRDYLVMEYIDGKTIAELISTKNPWLGKEQNVTRLLRELVDVVGYLHRQGVVHCDIKPDNILITNNGRNLVLADFDKCYTDSLNDTSGHPAKYGLSVEQVGKTSLDFRGIAHVAKSIISSFPKLKPKWLAKFLKACNQEDINADQLLEILKETKLPRIILISIGLIVLIAILGIGIFMSFSKSKQQENTAPKEDIVVEEKTMEPITQEALIDGASQRAAALDQRIAPYFEELTAVLDSIAVMKQDGTVNPDLLIEKWTTLSEKEDEYKNEACEILKDMYPDITSERELWRILSQSKVLSAYNRRYEEVRSLGFANHSASPKIMRL